MIVFRFFKKPIHNDLVELVLKRVKCMLGYPESKPDLISPNSVLYRYVRSYVFMCVYVCTYIRAHLIVGKRQVSEEQFL